MAKPFLGVVHLLPLPSSAGGGTGNRGFAQVLDRALADAEALASGGVDGILVENFGDVPFHKGTKQDPVPPDVVAGLAVAAKKIQECTGLPLAVNCLRNDAMAALGVAAVIGARWVRVNVWSGACLTDQGLMDGEAARVLAYRRQLGTQTEVLADLLVKHAAPLVVRDPAAWARDLAERSGAWGLILSGDRTGEAVDLSMLKAVKGAVGDFPVWIGSGLGQENAKELWPHCDGAIVGTALKRGGEVLAGVDPTRVRALRQCLAGGS